MNKRPTQNHQSEEYIWRFKLNLDSSWSADGAMVDLFRNQVKALLDIVILTHKGKPVSVDGFAFLYDQETCYHIFDSSSSVAQKLLKKGGDNHDE